MPLVATQNLQGALAPALSLYFSFALGDGDILVTPEVLFGAEN